MFYGISRYFVKILLIICILSIICKVSFTFGENLLVDNKYYNNVVVINNLFEILPLQNAIQERHGNGNLKIAIFTDIYCPYCRKLEQILDEIDNLTIYNFIVPVLGNATSNFVKSMKIWCNKDQANTWNQFMSKGIEVPNVKNCNNPIKANKNLFYALGFSATPIMIFPNGKYYEGGLLDKNLLIQVIKENQ